MPKHPTDYDGSSLQWSTTTFVLMPREAAEWGYYLYQAMDVIVDDPGADDGYWADGGWDHETITTARGILDYWLNSERNIGMPLLGQVEFYDRKSVPGFTELLTGIRISADTINIEVVSLWLQAIARKFNLPALACEFACTGTSLAADINSEGGEAIVVTPHRIYRFDTCTWTNRMKESWWYRQFYRLLCWL